MIPKLKSEKPLAAIFFVVVFVALFGFNHLIELRWEEPRRALVAMEMMLSGDYVVPHTVGLDYYNKPPVFNWVLVLFMKLFGSCEEWVVRLPGVLSLFATAFFSFKISKQYFDRNTALVIAGALLTIVDLMLFETIYSGEIDLFYMLVVALQALSIFHFSEKQSYWALFLVSYFLAAVGILTKGAPSLAFQGLTLLGYFIITKRFWKLFSIQHFTGIGLMIAMVGGYFWIYSKEGDVAVYLVGLFKDASQKSANESNSLGVLRAIGEFPFRLIHLMLPWSVFLPILFIKRAREQIKANPLAMFSVVFILANIIIYVLAPSLRIRYMYMFLPFLLIVIIPPALEFIKEKNVWVWFLTFIAVVIMVAGMALPVLPSFIPEFEWTACLLMGLVLFATGLVSFVKRKSTHSIWLFLPLLATIKLGFNAVVLPALPKLDPHLAYEQNMIEMIEKTDGEGFAIYDSPWPQPVDVSLMGHQLVNRTIDRPAIIHYQLPHYYTMQTGTVLQHNRNLESGKHYMAYRSRTERITNNIEELHSFPVPEHDDVILFRVK